jgi:hypothetical protein
VSDTRARTPAAAGAASEGEFMQAVALDKLPPQLKELVRVLGEGPAFNLVKWLGGTTFWFPKSRSSRQFAELVEIVGLQAADAAVAELGTEAWQLPKYDSVLRQMRHARVVELKRVAGLSNPEVALRTGYTVRQVINICNEAGLAQAEREAFLAAQGDLFGEDAEPADGATNSAPHPAAAPGA